jgi:hypothetical protein
MSSSKLHIIATDVASARGARRLSKLIFDQGRQLIAHSISRKVTQLKPYTHPLIVIMNKDAQSILVMRDRVRMARKSCNGMFDRRRPANRRPNALARNEAKNVSPSLDQTRNRVGALE